MMYGPGCGMCGSLALRKEIFLGDPYMRCLACRWCHSTRLHLIPDVYFIRSQQGEIKIGSSCQPEKRLAQLQTSCPYPLQLLGVIREAGSKIERELHQKFDHLRLMGEWFTPAPELLQFIDEEAS